MLKIRMKMTGEIKDVTNNEAFGLIDSGQGELVKAQQQPPQKEPQEYRTRQLRPKYHKK